MSNRDYVFNPLAPINNLLETSFRNPLVYFQQWGKPKFTGGRCAGTGSYLAELVWGTLPSVGETMKRGESNRENRRLQFPDFPPEGARACARYSGFHQQVGENLKAILESVVL